MSHKKGQAKIKSRMKNKLALLFVIIVLALIAVNIRLAYINETNGDKYTKKVLSQQSTNSITLPYKRGDILDRNGSVLATSEKVYNVILDPVVLKEYASDDPEKDCVEPTIKTLSAYFQIDEGELRQTLIDKSESSYVVLLKRKTKDEIVDLENQIAESGSKIKGVWFEDDYLRKYPNNELGCHVIGYTVSGNQGQTGIEEYYSEVLNGVNGRSYSYLNEDLEQDSVVQEATAGYSVVSTIDATLQGIVEKYIDKFIEDYTNKNIEGPAAKNIGVVMMNPQNGEIYAMAGDIDFDLNNPHDLVGNGYVTQEALELMTEEEQLDAKNQMWRNFCISDGFEPGSTVKPMTVAGALESGSVNANTTFLCDGGQTIVTGQPRIKCVKRSGHGIISLGESIKFSCNDALMQIASMEGYTGFLKYQEMFNFGLKTNIDLPGEANNAFAVFSEETLGPTELATSSFGQGFNVTMIQEIAAFSSIINGGYYYKPQVVNQIIDIDGRVVENLEPTLVKQTISRETSNILRGYLYETMYGGVDDEGNHATGRKSRVAGYSMGGKTGTAQKIPRSAGTYLVSFIGFAPVDTPQVVCYVVVDEPNAGSSAAQASSVFAQEIFKNIMTEAMPYLNVPATEPIPEDMLDEVPVVDDEPEGENLEGNTEGEVGNGLEDTSTQIEPGSEVTDPNTGEVVTMPTTEEIEQDTGGFLDGILSVILGDGEEETTDPESGDNLEE